MQNYSETVSLTYPVSSVPERNSVVLRVNIDGTKCVVGISGEAMEDSYWPQQVSLSYVQQVEMAFNFLKSLLSDPSVRKEVKRGGYSLFLSNPAGYNEALNWLKSYKMC